MKRNWMGNKTLCAVLSLLLISCGGEENSFLEDVDNIPVRPGLLQENNFDLAVRRVFTLTDENFIASEHFAVFYGLNIGPLENEARLVLQEAEEAWSLGIDKHGMKVPARSDQTYIPMLFQGTDPSISNIGANGTYQNQRAYYISLNSSAFLNSTGGANTGSVRVVRQVFETFVDPRDPTNFMDLAQWYASSIPGLMTQKLYPDNTLDIDLGVAYAMNPQLPLWSYDDYLIFQKGSSDLTWSEENHAAGKEIWLSYLVDNDILTIDEIIAAISESRDFNGLAYLVDTLETKGIDSKRVFADFCNRTVTWDYKSHGDEYESLQIIRSQIAESENEPNNTIIDTIRVEGTNGMLASLPDLAPAQWAYNVYYFQQNGDSNYEVTFQGDEVGSDGSPSEFLTSVVRRKRNIRTYEPLNMSDAVNGSITLTNLSAEEDVYIVIVSVPDIYEGNIETFNFNLDVSPTM